MARHDHCTRYILLLGWILVLWGLTLGWAGPAAAQGSVAVTIDPGQFAGSYIVRSASLGATLLTGVRVLTLAPGSYDVDVGMSGSCSRKTFVVNGDGTVGNSPVNDSAGAFAFDGSTVRFKNATVQFDPGQFRGLIWVELSHTGAVGPFAPPGSLVVVPDTVYDIRLPAVVFSWVYFQVTAEGAVAAPGPLPAGCVNSTSIVPTVDALSFSGTTVHLKNTIVRLDPRQYQGYYAFWAAGGGWQRGPQDFVLIPGFDYGVNLTSLNYFGWISFKLGGDGSLAYYPTGKDSTRQIEFDNVATPPTVQFRNAMVTFDPGRYAGFYRFDTATPVGNGQLSGLQNIVHVPDTYFEMRLSGSRIGPSRAPLSARCSTPRTSSTCRGPPRPSGPRGSRWCPATPVPGGLTMSRRTQGCAGLPRPRWSPR